MDYRVLSTQDSPSGVAYVRDCSEERLRLCNGGSNTVQGGVSV
jgi:hypothetical protein